MDRIGALVLTGGKLHADDTPVRVLEAGKKQYRTVLGVPAGSEYVGPTEGNTAAGGVRLDPSRSAKRQQLFLEGYDGYLQADAYPGDQSLYDSGRVQEVACWVHARLLRGATGAALSYRWSSQGPQCRAVPDRS